MHVEFLKIIFTFERVYKNGLVIEFNGKTTRIIYAEIDGGIDTEEKCKKFTIIGGIHDNASVKIIIKHNRNIFKSNVAELAKIRTNFLYWL